MLTAPPAAALQAPERQYTGWPVSLPLFEGPLDLLLHLIQRDQIDIYDIPIARITAQYLEYLAVIEELRPEVAGDFLVMAATLLEIKSRLLLPQPERPAAEEEEDPRAALVAQLLEYRRYKAAAAELQDRLTAQVGVFARPPEEGGPEVFLDGEPSALDLYAALERVLAEAEATPEPGAIARPAVTIKMKMAELLSRLARAGETGLRFADLFNRPLWRLEVVVTFLALLELVKLHRARVRQRNTFGEIVILGRD